MQRNFGSYFLLVILVGVMILCYFIFEPFLVPLILAAVFATILHPLYERTLTFMPLWKSTASLLTVLLATLLLMVPLSIIGTQVGLQAAVVSRELVSGEARVKLTESIQKVEDMVSVRIPAARGFSEKLSTNISTYAQAVLTWLVQNSGAAVTGVASFFLSLFIFFVALYYLVRDGERLKSALIEYSPLRDSYDESVFEKLRIAVYSVVRGNLTIACIQGVIAGLGFWIFGVPQAVLWGSLAAFAALVPGVGTAMVFTPIIIYLFLSGETVSAIGLLVWGALAVGLVDNMLAPTLIGAGIKMHPLLVLLSVLGGLTFFGAIGVILGPLSLSLLFAFLSIYSSSAREVS